MGSGTSLRKWNTSNSVNNEIIKADESLNIEIYNTTGLLVFKSSLSGNWIESEYQKFKNKITSGLYLYRISNSEGKPVKSGKWIL